MEGNVWLDCRCEFRYVPWAALRPGDVIYYLIPGPNREWAHGPFVAVDPATCRLCNGQGVEFRLPRVLPLLPAASGQTADP